MVDRHVMRLQELRGLSSPIISVDSRYPLHVHDVYRFNEGLEGGGVGSDDIDGRRHCAQKVFYWDNRE